MFRQAIDYMKKAGHFLKNPLLQYIPITVRTLGKSEHWSNPFSQAGAHLFLFQDPQVLKSAMGRYQITANIPDTGNELYVLTINFQARLVLFRYLTCKIIGTSEIGSYHVFAITKKYFPRRSLHFALYEDDGRKLKYVNEEIY